MSTTSSDDGSESDTSRETGLEVHTRLQELSEDDVGDYCAWWVVIGGYTSMRSSFVHLPEAIRYDADGDPLDPETEPPAATLCYIDSREGTSWRVKSHAVMPVGYRRVCGKCMKALAEETVNE